MTGRPVGEPTQQTHCVADAAHRGSPFSNAVASSEAFGSNLSDTLVVELGNLQKLVCELLFKNQQLRMALMEAEATRELADTIIQIE
jgi:hypothetical protein